MRFSRGGGVALAGIALAFCSSLLLANRTEIVEGNPAAAIRVIIYEDLQGADCQNLRAMLDEKILPRYGSRVAFVHRDFPMGKHEWARQAAVAARWVYAQDPRLGLTFRRELMSEHDHITAATLKPWLLEFAARNNLDQPGILDCLTAPKWNAMVDQDYQGAVARGVSHAPTVYVGGQKLEDTILYDDFARALDIELGH
jgi:protein-disulfide isomerase